MHDRSEDRCCVILPAFNEQNRIGKVVTDVRAHHPDVVVVDDGSSDGTAEEAEAAGAVVIKHGVNRGKGAALQTGFTHARENAFVTVITMDSDGQHDPVDVPRFIEAYVRTGIPVLIGNRMADQERMPAVRRLTNRFMSWLLSRKMGQYVPDSQCGYRLYRCDVLQYTAIQSRGYAAESEILMILASRDIRMDAVPIAAIYGDEESKIHPVRDTIRFFLMLRRCEKRLGRR